jgi:uncharacterized protein (DUF488 family)
MQLFTIGHSSHPIDVFTRSLFDHEIACLVDVRSSPYSRFHPQFNKNALQQVMQVQGIDYTWAGESLGGRPKDPACYKHHAIPVKAADYINELSYPAVMQRPWFIEGIQHLLVLAGQQTTCILCAEKDPAHCHRHHLITAYLLLEYPQLDIWHILADGSLVDARSIHNLNDPSNGQQLSF